LAVNVAGHYDRALTVELLDGDAPEVRFV